MKMIIIIIIIIIIIPDNYHLLHFILYIFLF